MDIKQNYKVVFTNDAIIDMDNTFNYISKNLNSPRAAQNLMRNVNDAIENLKYMPKMHVVIKNHPELEMEHRRIVIDNYVIIYTVNEIEKKVYYKGKNYFCD